MKNFILLFVFTFICVSASQAKESDISESTLVFGESKVSVANRVLVETVSLLPTNINAKLSSDGEELVFLQKYYKAGWQGNRDVLLNLYSAQLKQKLLPQYPTNSKVKEQFQSLSSVKLISSIHFGSLRLVLAEHIGEIGTRPYSWVHTISCVKLDCLFVEDADSMKLASLFARNSLKIKNTVGATKGREAVFLLPSRKEFRNGETSSISKLTTNPAISTKAELAIAASLSILQSSDLSNSKLSEIFLDSSPNDIDVVSAKDASVVTYELKTFLRYFKNNSPWRIGPVWMLSENRLAASMIASNGDVFNMLLKNLGNGFKIIGKPEDDFFELLQTDFYRASIAGQKQ